jgi:hypothetical protein
MKLTKNLLLTLSGAMLAFTLSACNNAASNNTTANNANKPNATVNNTAPVSETKTNQSEANTNKPADSSNERKEVLDALRVPVSKDLKQEIIFVVDKFKTQGDWAFVAGQPKNKDGGEPNWKLTEYQENIDNDDFEKGLYALLKKTDGKWKVVTYMMNCHDVCYLGWDKEFKAPKALFE